MNGNNVLLWNMLTNLKGPSSALNAGTLNNYRVATKQGLAIPNNNGTVVIHNVNQNKMIAFNSK